MAASIEQSDLEGVGPAFDPQQLMAVRDMTRQAIALIAAAMRPGMLEEDAVELARTSWPSAACCAAGTMSTCALAVIR